MKLIANDTTLYTMEEIGAKYPTKCAVLIDFDDDGSGRGTLYALCDTIHEMYSEEILQGVKGHSVAFFEGNDVAPTPIVSITD